MFVPMILGFDWTDETDATKRMSKKLSKSTFLFISAWPLHEKKTCPNLVSNMTSFFTEHVKSESALAVRLFLAVTVDQKQVCFTDTSSTGSDLDT